MLLSVLKLKRHRADSPFHNFIYWKTNIISALFVDHCYIETYSINTNSSYRYFVNFEDKIIQRYNNGCEWYALDLEWKLLLYQTREK